MKNRLTRRQALAATAASMVTLVSNPKNMEAKMRIDAYTTPDRTADPDAALYDLIAEYERLDAAVGAFGNREEAIYAAAKRDAPPLRISRTLTATMPDYWTAMATRNPDMDNALRRHGMPELEAERAQAAEAAWAAFDRILEYEPKTLAGLAAKSRTILFCVGLLDDRLHPDRWTADDWRGNSYEPEFALAVITRDIRHLERQPGHIA